MQDSPIWEGLQQSASFACASGKLTDKATQEALPCRALLPHVLPEISYAKTKRTDVRKLTEEPFKLMHKIPVCLQFRPETPDVTCNAALEDHGQKGESMVSRRR